MATISAIGGIAVRRSVIHAVFIACDWPTVMNTTKPADESSTMLSHESFRAFARSCSFSSGKA